MNKIAKTVLMTGTALCAAGVVLSTAGYFAGGKDFTYTSVPQMMSIIIWNISLRNTGGKIL